MESVDKRRTFVNIGFEDNIKSKILRDYSKEYRDRIKSDPDFYLLHRQSETLRIQEYRDKRETESCRESDNVSIESDKRKMEKTKTSKPKTRQSQEIQRIKWKEEKYKQRMNMSYQKKTAINANRRAAMKESKSKLSTVSTIEERIMKEISTTNAFRTAKSRQKQKLSFCLNVMTNNPSL